MFKVRLIFEFIGIINLYFIKGKYIKEIYMLNNVIENIFLRIYLKRRVI